MKVLTGFHVTGFQIDPLDRSTCSGQPIGSFECRFPGDTRRREQVVLEVLAFDAWNGERQRFYGTRSQTNEPGKFHVAHDADVFGQQG